MSDSFPIDPSEKASSGSARRVLLMGTASAAAALIFLFTWAGSGRRAAPPAPVHLAFGPAEHAYAANVHVDDIALSRAENFLHQEVITLQGNLINAGDSPLGRVELTIDFMDGMNEVVLRQSMISSAPAPLAPKGSRPFEVSFEHIPSSWNMQSPLTYVTGLELAAQK